MAAPTEVVRDGPRGGEEALGVAGRLAPLPALLPLAGGLRRVPRTGIAIARLPRGHARQNLALSGPVALQFIGNEHPRHVRQSLEQCAEASLRGLLVPAALHQAIQHVPVLIDRPPQIVTFSLDSEKHFVHLPRVTRPRAAATELIRILLSEFATPFPDCFIGHEHVTFTQELFHIAEA